MAAAQTVIFVIFIVPLVLQTGKRKKRLSSLTDVCVREKTMKQQLPLERTTKLEVFVKSDLYFTDKVPFHAK